MVPLALKVPPVPPVTMAPLALKVLLDPPDPQVTMAPLARKALSDPPDLLGLPDPQVTMAPLALKVQQALKVRFPMVLKLAKCTIGMGMLGFIYLLV